MDMKERLQELAENARKRIEESEGLDKLNDVRVAYLGKKGELTAILKGMKDVAPEERPKVGQLVNETRAKIEELLEASKKDFEEKVREEKMKAEVIDVTLPAKKAKIGHRHPNTIALEEVERIFIGMGYEVVEGPEIEYADYNFTKLNIPEDHLKPPLNINQQKFRRKRKLTLTNLIRIPDILKYRNTQKMQI